MMTPHELRTLGLAVPSAPGRPTYISAASGLVRIASWLYVVADDEHHLGVFREGSLSPGSLFRLMEGDLPPDKEDRKKHKPDFEALVRLPPFGDCTHGALLAVGSGSRDNRRQGVLVRLTDAGALRGAPNPVDLSFILRPHEEVFAAVNIPADRSTPSSFVVMSRIAAPISPVPQPRSSARSNRRCGKCVSMAVRICCGALYFKPSTKALSKRGAY